MNILRPSGTAEALLIFARYPRLGQVKTRLVPALSPRQALDLHEAFLLDTIERTATLPVTRILFLADASEAELRRYAATRIADPALQLRRQNGSGLGDRLARAAAEVLAGFDRVVIIGTDSPTLPLVWLRQAFERLRERPVVLGPARDGGYYLIGLAEPRFELFEGIDWGTRQVLGETLARLRKDEYFLLKEWYDVDTGGDLKPLKRDLDPAGEGFPHRTASFFEGLGRLTI